MAHAHFASKAGSCLQWRDTIVLLLFGTTAWAALAQVCTASTGDRSTTCEVPCSCTPHFLHGVPLGVTVSPTAFAACLLVNAAQLTVHQVVMSLLQDLMLGLGMLPSA